MEPQGQECLRHLRHRRRRPSPAVPKEETRRQECLAVARGPKGGAAGAGVSCRQRCHPRMHIAHGRLRPQKESRGGRSILPSSCCCRRCCRDGSIAPWPSSSPSLTPVACGPEGRCRGGGGLLPSLMPLSMPVACCPEGRAMGWEASAIIVAVNDNRRRGPKGRAAEAGGSYHNRRCR